ncbi:MAG: tetratricopeptide repeat protein [Acidobacteriota bacterium]|nr:tetratricopeptide repeat protein [Acidobacteriota bacterium]
MSITKTLLYASTLFLLGLPASAQTGKNNRPANFSTQSQNTDDGLARHLTAAETFQLSGDLPNAAVENRSIIAIALVRAANLTLAEGQTQRAIKMFGDALTFSDDAPTHLNLADAYLQISEIDRAIAETRAALKIDDKNTAAHYLLGRLLYGKGDYETALPELENTIRNQPDFDSAYALGVTYLNLKQPERAKLLFEEMQTAVKESDKGLHLLFGRAYEQTGYYPLAEAEYRRELALNPKTKRTHFLVGYLILQHGGSERLGEAGKEFEAELQLSPDDFYSNFFRGVVASSEGEHRKAVEYLQKAIIIKPQTAEAYLFLGQSQIELGGTAAAEKSLRKAIELSPNDDKKDFQLRRTHFLLGRLLLKSGRAAEGAQELAKAREIQGEMLANVRDEVGKILNQVVSRDTSGGDQKSGGALENPAKGEQPALTAAQIADLKKSKAQLSEILAQAFHNLGVIAAQQSATDDALADFAAAAEWQPDFPGLNRNWGIVAFRANQFDKAIEPLTRHLKTKPDDTLARRMLGVSWYLTKNYRQAVETLKPIEASLPQDAELAYFYGISLVGLERQKEAAVVFKKLAEQNQPSAQARFYAAQGLALIGDLENAVKEFRAVAALDANFPQARYNAGQMLIRLNRLEEAEKEFRQELTINPNDEQSKYSIAYILLERKTNSDEAIALLREAIAARPDYADARYQLGKALIEKGDLKEAVEHLEAAAQSEPKKDYIHYQLSIAYRRADRAADAERELKIFRELKEANRREKPAAMGGKTDAP